MRHRDHWPRHARQWDLVGPPLRPTAVDVAIVEGAVAALGRPVQGVVLGVTPELATMAWPVGSTVLAVDRSPAVIDAIFPRARLIAEVQALAGDWLALPVGDRRVDVVVGDGCLSNLAFPDGYRALAAELRRVLVADGRAILRVFAAPAARAGLAEVAAALAAGQVASLHALKWRVAMAIQPDDRNVAVVDIARAFDALVPDRAALAAATGWAPAVIDTVDAYRDSDLRYSFPTQAEVEAALGADLAVIGRLGGAAAIDRYPTLVWTPR